MPKKNLSIFCCTYSSVFVRQNRSICSFSNTESWVILSPIEKRIKEKIEHIGTPLKNWDISINYGIKTGFNDAFIISGEKRKQLIEQDPKSEEIIRPILRGRDIKRYSYDFADLWLINTHNGIKEKGINPINIDDYPAIKEHLDQYYVELEKRADRGATPYNLRNCAYMDDFSKQKIVWLELTDHPNFCLDDRGYFINNTVFFITGDRLPYILSFLNSKLCEWYFTKIAATSGAGTRRWIKIYIEQICIPKNIKKENENLLESLVNEIQNLKQVKANTRELEDKVEAEIFKLFNLSDEEVEFVENQ